MGRYRAMGGIVEIRLKTALFRDDLKINFRPKNESKRCSEVFVFKVLYHQVESQSEKIRIKIKNRERGR